MINTCSLNEGIVCINNNNLLLILIHQVHTLTCSYCWVFQYYYFVWYGLIPTTTVADSDLKVSGESALPVPKIKGATLKIYFSGPQFGLEIRWRPSPPPLGPLPWGLSPGASPLDLPLYHTKQSLSLSKEYRVPDLYCSFSHSLVLSTRCFRKSNTVKTRV